MMELEIHGIGFFGWGVEGTKKKGKKNFEERNIGIDGISEV